MQTYANLMSSGGYRPHLDSVDFIKFLRVSVVIALILAMAFSIRGNFKGLMQTLERDVMWLGIIALAITVTSSLLSMISVVKVSEVFTFQDPAAGICFFPLKTIQRRPYNFWRAGGGGLTLNRKCAANASNQC